MDDVLIGWFASNDNDNNYDNKYEKVGHNKDNY